MVSLTSPLEFCKRNKRRSDGILGEGVTKWNMAATRCAMMFFLIPKNDTSERPIAVMPTLIRWWEVVRAPEVAT